MARGDSFAVIIAADAIENKPGQGKIPVEPRKPRATAPALRACLLTSRTSTTGAFSNFATWAVLAVSAVIAQAVEKAHDAFDQSDIGVGCGLLKQGGQAGRRYHPGIEITARPARGPRHDSLDRCNRVRT